MVGLVEVGLVYDLEVVGLPREQLLVLLVVDLEDLLQHLHPDPQLQQAHLGRIVMCEVLVRVVLGDPHFFLQRKTLGQISGSPRVLLW